MTTALMDPLLTITPRQLELLALYASGYELREIAEVKFLSYSAVQQSLAVARERAQARSLTHLAVMCLDAGLLRKNGIGYKPVQDERVIG